MNKIYFYLFTALVIVSCNSDSEEQAKTTNDSKTSKTEFYTPEEFKVKSPVQDVIDTLILNYPDFKIILSNFSVYESDSIKNDTI